MTNEPTPDSPADTDSGAPQRCGFVAVIGAPNAGKSTLVNQLVGAKISIVTPKAQTTRTRVRGVAMRGDTQVVLIDTPGIFEPRKRIDRAMVAAAWEGSMEADRVLLVVDARRGMTEAVSALVERLAELGRPCSLALNKVDAMEREKLLGLAARFNEAFPFERIFMISALTGSGCDDVLQSLADSLPQGPWMFDPDDLSDLPQRLLAAEITREKIFLQLHEELPYASAVHTDRWEEKPDGSIRIEQTIFIERDTQRAIMLGKGGARIKAIGQAARTELSSLLEQPVHLFLHVKVNERLWEDRESYSTWGLDYNA
ncbi:GTPase Era [Phaeovibrio sulfidiphilus]|uniref:GTPase Era n=1 Tax=Phaeovibrio sulfidiphilus TaxID=1220600 RepID=A0A8J6YTR7_9PROT|nr:GTPase Era [Phaeovibrio sulfidiphilus]MBE1236269.1 GTPase Era [Phaeovibrio sulfidiphilus]